jgi:hypothetical protein
MQLLYCNGLLKSRQYFDTGGYRRNTDYRRFEATSDAETTLAGASLLGWGAGLPSLDRWLRTRVVGFTRWLLALLTTLCTSVPYSAFDRA